VTRHLTSDEQIDSLEGTLGPARAAHLDGCHACRAALASLRETFEQARRVEVPEPSPLFWSHQAARISEAVASDSPRRPHARWTYAAWAGGAAVVMAAALLLVRTPSTPLASMVASAVQPREARAALPVSSATLADDGADEAAWSVLKDLGGEIDPDAAVALTPATGAADRALDDLDADERAELVRVLQQELKGRAG
jgi:predicted anti-sigma-YlaC factor YlaD